MTDRTPDFSYLDPMSECERKWYYRFALGIEPLEPFVPMLAGSVMHKALATLYASEWNEERALTSLVNAYAASDIVPIGDYAYMTSGHLQTVLKNYIREYREREPYQVLSLIEEPIVEDIGVGAPVGGIPDLLVQDGDSHLVLDHKCTSGWLANLHTRVKFKHQFRIYALLAEARFGVKVSGAVCNAIYIGEKASVAGSKAQKFDRWVFEYSDSQLEETRAWLRQMMVKVARAKDLSEDWEHPQSGGVGCKYCEYSRLCESAPEVRPMRVKMWYKTKEIGGTLASGADHD